MRSDVVEYAPERSLTVRAADEGGATVAFAKAYAPGVDTAGLAAVYTHLADGLRDAGRGVASPHPLGWSAARGLLVLEAMPGCRWSDVDDRGAPAALRALGQAIATVHTLEPPAGVRPFGRLAATRVAHSAELIARARPDVAAPVAALAGWLRRERPDDGEEVLLHGDCHPKNALVADGQLSLVDLDQAGRGAPAADIGSLLARLRHGARLGERDPATTAAMTAAFLDGYRGVRPVPGEASLRWHTVAALLAERAMRAVNRVNRPALEGFQALLDEAESIAREGLDA